MYPCDVVSADALLRSRRQRPPPALPFNRPITLDPRLHACFDTSKLSSPSNHLLLKSRHKRRDPAGPNSSRAPWQLHKANMRASSMALRRQEHLQVRPCASAAVAARVSQRRSRTAAAVTVAVVAAAAYNVELQLPSGRKLTIQASPGACAAAFLSRGGEGQAASARPAGAALLGQSQSAAARSSSTAATNGPTR
jgi:hypothetical protein